VRNHFWPFTDVLQKMRCEVTRKIRFAVEALKCSNRGLRGWHRAAELLAANQETGAIRNSGITDRGYN